MTEIPKAFEKLPAYLHQDTGPEFGSVENAILQWLQNISIDEAVELRTFIEQHDNLLGNQSYSSIFRRHIKDLYIAERNLNTLFSGFVLKELQNGAR